MRSASGDNEDEKKKKKVRVNLEPRSAHGRAVKNPTNLGRREFNSTLYQSSYGFATRVHGFATKTKALAREIPPATQANENLTFRMLVNIHFQK